MPHTINSFVYNGTTQFDLNFSGGFRVRSDVTAYKRGTTNIPLSFNWINDTRVQIVPTGLVNGDVIEFVRTVSKVVPPVDLLQPNNFTREAVLTAVTHTLQALQEVVDGRVDSFNGEFFSEIDEYLTEMAGLLDETVSARNDAALSRTQAATAATQAAASAASAAAAATSASEAVLADTLAELYAALDEALNATVAALDSASSADTAADTANSAASAATTAAQIALDAAAEAVGNLRVFTSIAEAVSIPAEVDVVIVNDHGLSMVFTREVGGPCLGGGWVPVGDVYPEHFDIIPGAPDETTKITALLDYTTATGQTVDWRDGVYSLSRYSCPHAEPKVVWRGQRATLFSTASTPLGPNWDNDYFVSINAGLIGTHMATSDMLYGQTLVSLPSEIVAQIVPGKTLVGTRSTRVIGTDDRSEARYGDHSGVSRIVNSTTVELERPIPANMRVGDTAGLTVTAVNPGARTVTFASLIGMSVSEARYRIQFNTIGGSASSVTLLPSSFDPATGTFTAFNSDRYPTGVQIGDSATIQRQVEIFVTHSCHIDIDGVGFKRPSTTTATAGDLGFRGLRVSRSNSAKITNSFSHGFSETGIDIRYSYRPHVSFVDIVDANRSYNGWDGTGYGISVYNTSYGNFEYISGTGCRRVLDISGTQAMSWDNCTFEVSGYGGGTTYDGGAFWPEGAGINSVLGSHGPGAGTVYKNSRGFGVYSIVTLRGSHEVVRGLYGAGSMNRMLGITYGTGCDVDGMYYTDGRPDWFPDMNLMSKFSSRGKLRAAVVIQSSQIVRGSSISIRNAQLSGVTHALLDVEGSGEVGAVSTAGVHITIDNQNGTTSEWHTIRRTGGGTPVLTGPIDLRGVSVRNHVDAPIPLVYHTSPTVWTFGLDGRVILPTGVVLTRIPNNGVVSLTVTGAVVTSLVSVHSAFLDRPWKMIDALVWATRTGNQAPLDNSTGVDILNVPLTGTTGGAGRISVSLRPTGTTSLFVENRTGDDQYVMVKCDTLM